MGGPRSFFRGCFAHHAPHSGGLFTAPRRGEKASTRYPGFARRRAKEIAVVLKTTEATVRRDWIIAKAWLFRYL
jgi:hypothetical protein